MKSSGPVFKRCRPLLGTLVEVKLHSADTASCLIWSEQVFKTIERLQSLLSFHDDSSALSELNRAPLGSWLQVPLELSEVLALATKLQDLSEGSFNVAVAEPLMRWGYLPGSAPKRQTWRHLLSRSFLQHEDQICRILPTGIDLGGIAKGYIVDAAVKVLRDLCPIHMSGVVNAGGDLRVFGPLAQVAVARPARLPNGIELELVDCALATSSVQAESDHAAYRRRSAYVDVRRRQPLTARRTAVVKAPSCAVADALTKIVLLAPRAVATRVAGHFAASFSVLPCG